MPLGVSARTDVDEEGGRHFLTAGKLFWLSFFFRVRVCLPKVAYLLDLVRVTLLIGNFLTHEER